MVPLSDFQDSQPIITACTSTDVGKPTETGPTLRCWRVFFFPQIMDVGVVGQCQCRRNLGGCGWYSVVQADLRSHSSTCMVIMSA
jgi:hypothetical protein